MTLYLCAAWLIVTFIVVETWVLVTYPQYFLPRFSCKDLPGITAWAALGCALFAISYEKILENRFDWTVKPVANDSGRCGWLWQARQDCNLLAGPFFPVEYRRTGKPSQNQTDEMYGLELATEILAHRDSMVTAIKAANHLVLRSNEARMLRARKKHQYGFVSALAREAEKFQRIFTLDRPTRVTEWQDWIQRLQAAEGELRQTLAMVESNPDFPLPIVRSYSDGYPGAAAFELQKWPGLTAEQLASIQENIQNQPYLTELLLIDFAIVNAMGFVA